MIIDIDKIFVSDRVCKNLSGISELADSIKRNGLINPILIDDSYHLINGARRLLACKSLGWSMIDAYMLNDYQPDESSEGDLRVPDRALKWTPKMLRKILPKHGRDDRKPCFICGDHENITEVHHLVQLSEMADLLNGGIADPKRIVSTITWLCPNCHAYVHAAMRGDIDVAMDVYMSPKWRKGFDELSQKRIEAISEIIG